MYKKNIHISINRFFKIDNFNIIMDAELNSSKCLNEIAEFDSTMWSSIPTRFSFDKLFFFCLWGGGGGCSSWFFYWNLKADGGGGGGWGNSKPGGGGGGAPLPSLVLGMHSPKSLYSSTLTCKHKLLLFNALGLKNETIDYYKEVDFSSFVIFTPLK